MAKNCGPKCQYFVGESLSHPGRGLCCSPDWILEKESCLCEIGSLCDLFRSEGSQAPVEVETVEAPQAEAVRRVRTQKGKEKRRFPRHDVYVPMSLKALGIIGSAEDGHAGVVIDISRGGLSILLSKDPVMRAILGSPAENRGLQFEACLKLDGKTEVPLVCEARHVKDDGTFLQIGVSFSDALSEEAEGILKERLRLSKL